MVLSPTSSQEDLATPLHVACTNSHYEMVKLLLLNGANIHIKDANGMTPILRYLRLQKPIQTAYGKIDLESKTPQELFIANKTYKGFETKVSFTKQT